jgi:acyl-CoA reductase-like NAD-dependent aldehyde dehydrogenase
MTDPRIAVLSALSSPGWHPVPEAHGMPWDEAEQLLAAYDASRAAEPAAAPSAPADRAAVLTDEAALIEAHCPDHGDADGVWMDCHCVVAEDMHRRAAELRRMADEAQQPEAQREVVHACPPDGSGLMPCCGRTPFELPRTDRMSADPTLVTCQPAAVSQPGKEA